MEPTEDGWSTASSRVWEKGKSVEEGDPETITGMMSRSTGVAQRGEGDAEMYVDTAASGSITKRQYAGVTDMKQKVNGRVVGVTGAGIKITHTAVSDKIGDVYIVPEASANLLSVPTLMRQGCTLGAKGEDLWVTDVRGKMKFRAKLSKNGMYMVRLSDISSSDSDGDRVSDSDGNGKEAGELKMENATRKKISALIAGVIHYIGRGIGCGSVM